MIKKTMTAKTLTSHQTTTVVTKMNYLEDKILQRTLVKISLKLLLHKQALYQKIVKKVLKIQLIKID
jgi:hypothetical protein